VAIGSCLSGLPCSFRSRASGWTGKLPRVFPDGAGCKKSVSSKLLPMIVIGRPIPFSAREE
jgi:hypothetical protein